ncbi:MAG: nucleoside deaminase [Phycisphaeraceae bacterium]
MHQQAATWLNHAIDQAIKSRDEGGIPIGSVLVDTKGDIVAAGHNLRVQTGDPTAHAEVACIRSAGRRRDWNTLTLVSTLSPCIMCSGTAILFRIPRVVIGENTTFVGAEELMRWKGVELITLHDDRCIDLMRTFIDKQPDLWNEDIGD